MTGAKWTTKKYYRHSRFFGSLKEKSAEQMRAEDSTFIISEAVRGMLPTNVLSKTLINKLFPVSIPNNPKKLIPNTPKSLIQINFIMLISPTVKTPLI